jgi:signal transduction histidine kinase
MYLPARIKSFPMSLYFGVALAMVTTLSISFVIFHSINTRVEQKTIDPAIDRIDELELESARAALDSGGPQALQNYLTRLNHVFRGASHYLLDSRGIDVISGDNRATMLPPPPRSQWRTRANGHYIRAHRSSDRQYWIVAVGIPETPPTWTYLPYYLLVIGATGALCWIAAIGVVSPVRRIASSIAQFGQGSLSVRVRSTRPDEIGQLGRSFNQMADRLQQLIVSERRLLGDISHELRSPLARLKFAIKLARTSPDTKSSLDRIERDVDRIAALVADIVEVNFIECGPAGQEAEIARAADIMDDVIRDCAVEAEIHGCRIAVTGRLAGEVEGNRELLRRAVENVLRNGIRYSPQHSTIDVSFSENTHTATISVRDCGPGVPEDALTRIFDPFFRVEEARDANGGGSGLGLSIAKQAVQVHHGTITAENASPGLRVQITIPLRSAPPRTNAGSPAPLTGSPGRFPGHQRTT